MTRNVSKRRRRENSVQYISDSTEEDVAPVEKEYFHKGKGKRKVSEVDSDEDQEEVEMKEEPPVTKEEKVVQVCGICLTEEEVERGKLDCCDHYFCFGCIMEWSKVESRCPTCKQRFVTIVRPPVPGVPRSRPRTFRIPFRNQVYEPSEEEIRLFSDPYLHVVCTECQEAGDERLLLLCDGCDAAAHTYCVGLGRSVPRGDWFCNLCSIQVHGFNSDEEEHDEEDNGEQEVEEEAESDENDSRLAMVNDSRHRHAMLVAEVTPIRQRRPPRRVPPPPLNRAGGRHTRLHPAPALSQEAQTLASHAASQSSSISSDIESTPGAARTLSTQRLIRQRVNDIRNNWDQIRSGELQFDSIQRSPPRTRASQAQASGVSNTLSPVPEVPRNDLSQAWAMMEQARALRGDRIVPEPSGRTRAPEPTVRTRAARNRIGSVPTSGVETTTARPSRVTETLEQNARTENARNGHALAENNPRLHNQEQISRREVNRSSRNQRGAAEEHGLRREGQMSLRNQRGAAEEHGLSREGQMSLRNQRGAAEEHGLRREGQISSRNQRGAAEEHGLRREGQISSRNQRGAAEEHGSRREGQISSRDLRDQSQERNVRGGRRRDNDPGNDVQTSSLQESRIGIGRDAIEGNLEDIPGSSREHERRHNRARRAQSEDAEALNRTRTSRRTSRELGEIKEQVAQYVKAELKPLYRLGHIDKDQHRSIARSATQELLAVFGIERSGPETRGFGSGSIACTHPSSPSTSTIWPNYCTQCVRQNVNKVVGVLVRRTVGIAIL